MQYMEIMEKLKSHASHKNVEGMPRFGISPKGTLGVSIPIIRKMAKKAEKNHTLALRLWSSGIQEARILAGLVDNPGEVSESQMEGWVKDFDSWDVCDQVCMNLFDKTPFAYKKAIEWSSRNEEFVKRAGFVLMASLSFHDKKSGNETFERFFPAIRREARDERNFVKKAVNWALRQIGKRNLYLNGKAIETARNIKKLNSKSAKWIASDALRELESKAVQDRLKKKPL